MTFVFGGGGNADSHIRPIRLEEGKVNKKKNNSKHTLHQVCMCALYVNMQEKLHQAISNKLWSTATEADILPTADLRLPSWTLPWSHTFCITIVDGSVDDHLPHQPLRPVTPASVLLAPNRPIPRLKRPTHILPPRVLLYHAADLPLWEGLAVRWWSLSSVKIQANKSTILRHMWDPCHQFFWRSSCYDDSLDSLPIYLGHPKDDSVNGIIHAFVQYEEVIYLLAILSCQADTLSFNT